MRLKVPANGDDASSRRTSAFKPTVPASSRNGESVSNAATGGNCASLRSEGISSRSAAASLPVAVSSEASPARASHSDSTRNAFTLSVSAVSEASTCNLIGTSPERSPSLPFFAA